MASGRRPFDRMPFGAAPPVRPGDHAAAALERLREEKSKRNAARSQLRREAGIQSAVRRLRGWTSRVPEPKSGPIDFARFPLHEALYSPELEAVPDMVVMKGTQVGVSTWSIRWCLFHVDTRGRTGLYVFPAKEQLADYVRLRIDPLFDGEYLKSRVGATNNVGFKNLGAGAIAFRGSNAESGLMSLDVDALVLDEYDSLVQSNIAEVEQRVTGPTSDGLIRRLGVPHHMEEGIHGEYLRSDQRVWNVRCAECRTWNPMLGPEAWKFNVDRVAAILRCRRCREPLDVKLGEWVAKWPDRTLPGFHLPKFAMDGVDIAGIVSRSLRPRQSDQERWHRNELGWPSGSSESRLSRDLLRGLIEPGLRMVGASDSVNLVTMGVDVGGRRPLNVTISEHLSPQVKRKLWVGMLPHGPDRPALPQLNDLMVRYGVNFAAIDANPEYQLAMSFAARWPGQVMRVLVGDSNNLATRMDEPIRFNDEDASAQVDRTLLLDTATTLFRMGNVVLPEDVPQEGENDYLREMGGLSRTMVAGKPGSKQEGSRRAVYMPVGAAPFDYLMAEGYDVVAADAWFRAQGLGILQMQQQAMPTAEDRPEAPGQDDLGYAGGVGDVEYRSGLTGDDDEFGGGV